MSTATVFELDDLSLEYPAHGPSPAFLAVSGLSLRLANGEVLGLMGEAGAGKSTLARVLSGQAAASRQSSHPPRIVGGQARVLDYKLRNIGGRRLTGLQQKVGFLGQDANSSLPPDLTAGEIIQATIYRQDKRADPRETALRVATLVDEVQLPLGVIDRYPYQLSSGQRQRVAIARALALRPSLLIADDPTAGVDVTVRKSVVDLVTGAVRNGDFAAMIISNDLSVLRRVTDRVAILHQGLLVGLGAVDEVLRDPQHPYVAQIAAADAHNRV